MTIRYRGRYRGQSFIVATSWDRGVSSRAAVVFVDVTFFLMGLCMLLSSPSNFLKEEGMMGDVLIKDVQIWSWGE